MSFATNLFLFNLQYDSAILEAQSAQNDFFLMRLALQAGNLALYTNYIDETALPSTITDSDQYSTTSSSNFEDDIFSNIDHQSTITFTPYYSDSSWGSTGTLVSHQSTSSSNVSSNVGNFSDYVYNLWVSFSNFLLDFSFINELSFYSSLIM